MNLSSAAAQVMTLAQDEQVAAAERLAAEALAQAEGAGPGDRAALWYAIAVLHHVRQDAAAAIEASEQCLRLAATSGSSGWAANALSMRAMALARDGAVEAALLDLARSEVELAACNDPALRGWAHTGLGYCYLELRLYELAQPHFEAAVRLDASPIPLPTAPAIDLMNLAELHLRWADELERVAPPDRVVGLGHGQRDDQMEAAHRHRETGHTHAIDAVTAAQAVGASGLLAASRAMELCSRPEREAARSVPQLRQAYANPDHRAFQGGRAAAGGALARALWNTGERDEALAVAREAAAASEAAGDWQIMASARWLLVELEARAGVPGADAGRAYGELLSHVLWQQRLGTLQGARAALDVERLRRLNEIAMREAAQDPLTGVGNRRALDDALRAAIEQGPEPPSGVEVGRVPAHSLLLVDLDEFKAINDLHGHIVGDEVLREVAAALRTAARAEDVVARVGGDEFVLFATEVDAIAGAALGQRVSQAIEAVRVESSAGPLRLRASVGVATTGGDVAVSDLLGVADEAMYRAKGRARYRAAGDATAGQRGA